MKKSFYDWCLETNNEYLLELWDYNLNLVSPKDVAYRTAKQYYFLCPRNIHESELYQINTITGNKHQIVNCRKCHSFGQWCLDNNQEELLYRWDYELNTIDPFHVSYSSGKKFYFKCPKGNPLHPSELKMISNLIKQDGSRKCTGCESFAQWCIDNVDKDFIEKYWSEKNTVNPFTITYSSNIKVWIKCQSKTYHDDYLIIVSNFISGERCPYCSGKKVNFYDSFGYNVPLSINFWSDRNDTTPYDYMPRSNKKVWFKCDIHGEYYSSIENFRKHSCICPKCLKESTASTIQMKVSYYIEYVLGIKCLHEEECTINPINPKTGCTLLYDNEIIDYKLIIEVNGQQHYEITNFAVYNSIKKGTTPEYEFEYQKWRDEYKKEYALSHGYYYLEIPYWTFDKQESYKTLINNKLYEINLQNNRLISTVTTTGDDR